MSRSFKALNIESDDESDVEFDDSKEIQIEDALKLYASALKSHAAGPAFFEQAAASYEQLFASEIFKYPESQPELARIELYGPTSEDTDPWVDQYGGDSIPAGGLDTIPSTLPQILHLSHKNFAQFKLEYLIARLDSLQTTIKTIADDANIALDHFVQALDKDDSDQDLWRKTASVGDILDSKRIARFCLETVLDSDDDEPNAGVFGQPGLLEGLASENLRTLVAYLQDDLSALQDSIPLQHRRLMSKFIKARLDTYSIIKTRATELLHLLPKSVKPERESVRVILDAPVTWIEMGEVVLEQHMVQTRGRGQPGSSLALSFRMPPSDLAKDHSHNTELVNTLSPQMSMLRFNLPQTLSEQFPGLDRGRPTTQPEVAAADGSMMSIVVGHSTPRATFPEADKQVVTLPSRKRSGDTAGLVDGAEEGRTKLRRTRNRESTMDAGDARQALVEANIRWEYQKKLEELEKVDEWMFNTAEKLFDRIGIVGVFDACKQVRHEVGIRSDDLLPPQQPPSASFKSLLAARSDFLDFLSGFNEQRALILTKEGDLLDDVPVKTVGATGPGFASQVSTSITSDAPSLPHDGIHIILENVNRGWYYVEDVAWEWLLGLLEPGRLHPTGNSYTEFTWPEALKTLVVKVLVSFDSHILVKAKDNLDMLRSASQNGMESSALASLAATIQAVFEIHLDIFTLIRQPKSGVDLQTITGQGDRLNRWGELSREAMRLRSILTETFSPNDELTLRFFWATTFQVAADADVTQEHVLECMRDLMAIFVEAQEPVILLPNNAIMPNLCLVALEKEKSRLTTKDFFLKVTDPELGDPVKVIESLEPLLDFLEAFPNTSNDSGIVEGLETSSLSKECSPDLVRFLLGSDLSIRMLLWQRLRDAYLAIDYKPMVVTCYFRMLRLGLGELKTSRFEELPRPERQAMLIKILKLMQSLITKILSLVQSADDPLESLDEQGSQSAVASLGEFLQIIQVFNVYQDSIRLNQTQPPTTSAGASLPSFSRLTGSLHDSQVQAWIVLYHLLKDLINQNQSIFVTPTEDRYEFLRSVHRNLGIRGFCGASNRALVRMLRDEFKTMSQCDGAEEEQSQVLYDLYGINCFVDPAHDMMEHGCTHDAFVDRNAALQAVDLLIVQASKLGIRDLVKHSLKDTIDKVHGTVVRKKPSEDILRNRETYRAFLKSPINPRDLFDCLKGEGNTLPILAIPKEDAILADKGWYALMGHISLTKFRSQKRNSPAPTEDLDIAIAFFNQDLEYTMDNWETWLRLAQAYDTKIEESVVWSAEKLNNNMAEVVQLQRTSIHCYTMATALANRSASFAFDTPAKMTELYAEFANRIYSSSREPFGMLAFSVEDQDRFISTAQGVEKVKSFSPLHVYTAWKFSKVLYKRALAGREDSWTLHYELGKCLWKMYAADQDVRRHDIAPPARQVLNCFIRAIELLPDKKDSREKREPTLEPHYKLVSIIHKLITRQLMNMDDAKQILSHTHYAKGIAFPLQMEDWVDYILQVLGKLKTADKSNWYHRIIARSAETLYRNPDLDIASIRAKSAKHELTQQMFTKTMVLQVWRPEAERAGRHFVYYARYTRFFVQILEELNDRANLEMLARRVRRRVHDVFEHSLVWQDICSAYMRLLRSHGRIIDGLETATFSNIVHDEFVARRDALEKWMQSQDVGMDPCLDVLRDVQELKKINGGLMKTGTIDDLIGDAYAKLFGTVGMQLWEDINREKQDVEAQRSTDGASPSHNPTMSLDDLVNVEAKTGAEADAEEANINANKTTQATTSDLAPTRKRAGVGRREIRTAAEACVQKVSAMEVKEAVRRQAVGTRVQVVIESNSGTFTDTSAQSSAPGSVHDSADDESELSELEEEEEEAGENVDGGDEDTTEKIKYEKTATPGLMFPGLDVSRGNPTPAVHRDLTGPNSDEQTDGALAIVMSSDIDMIDASEVRQQDVSAEGRDVINDGHQHAPMKSPGNGSAIE